MKCLIIAAGKGSRLRLRSDSKPLIPIWGVPLIERVIRSAREFRCTAAIFGALERCAEETGDTSLSGAVRVLAGEGRAKAADIDGHFWIDVDDSTTVRQAEKALLADLGDEPNDSRNIVTQGEGRSTLRPYVLNV